MENIGERIRRESYRIADELVKIRRQLHMYPELSYQEEKTAQLVAERLKALGLRVSQGVARTGVVGLLGDGEPRIGFRADMDALPIEEQNDTPYRSRVPGVMHACGHDAHTTCLLGAAMILSGIRSELQGSVKFIFQPSEERNPGGAVQMIQEGVLENPPLDAIFALHSDPRLRVGEIGYRVGPTMAEPDEFSITILGKGGHAASPHMTVDPIVIAAETILALQKIPSRLVDPTDPVVVTIGKIQGGSATNVIPDAVEIEGTVRSLNPQVAAKVPELMRRILDGITGAYGATYQFHYDFGYPVLINDPDMTQFLVQCGQEYLGEDSVKELDRPSMGGEDFAYFLQRVKGSFFRLGTGNPQKGIVHYWHSSRYDIDEDALPVGAGFLAYLAYRFLTEARDS